MSSRNIVAPRRRRAPRRPLRIARATQQRDTREQLLETAGQLFAEKGFAEVTGKEICERAGANAAAVVYHFGGLEELYRAVLNEARSRLAPSEALAAAVASQKDPQSRLEAFMELLMRALSGPMTSTWAARLVSREIVSPTAIFDEVRNKEMRARALILRSIVSDLSGLPADHPTVGRACINIMAPFGILFIISPQRVERIFPALSFNEASVREMTRHMVQYALAGIAAVAKEARPAPDSAATA